MKSRMTVNAPATLSLSLRGLDRREGLIETNEALQLEVLEGSIASVYAGG